jgi:hypothetical protein
MNNYFIDLIRCHCPFKSSVAQLHLNHAFEKKKKAFRAIDGLDDNARFNGAEGRVAR